MAILPSAHYQELFRDTAYHAGFGEVASPQSSNEEMTPMQRRIHRWIEAGVQAFWQPLDPQNGLVHEWSFLFPLMDLDLVQGQDTYAMPHDFSDIKGSVKYVDETHPLLRTRQIEVVNHEAFDAAVQRGEGDFQPGPRICTVRPSAGATQIDGMKNQFQGESDWVLVFYPSPKRTFHVRFIYAAHTPCISPENPLPKGWKDHSEAIRYACLSVMEVERYAGQAHFRVEFHNRIAVSVIRDKNSGNRGHYFGMNTDGDGDTRSLHDVPVHITGHIQD